MPTLTAECSTTPIARSSADIRQWIVGKLARSLNVDPSAIDTAAPLESLGVGSLEAMGITGELAGWLNRDLSATLMWDYTSIEAIANGLADHDTSPKAPTWPGVINLQPHGTCLPIFFFPGLGGHPVTFANLASHLGTMQPCYGLTVPGLNGEETPRTRVEDIATAMLQTIRLVQPRGPYQLAGYSFGGLLAYETARQLTAMGETVSMLAIYDAFTPRGRRVRPRWQRVALHGYLLATRPGRLQYLRAALKRRKTLADAKKVEVEAPTAPTDQIRKTTPADLGLINARAVENYHPQPFAGSVVLFRAIDLETYNIFYKMDASGGWAEVAAGGVRVIDLAGCHLSMLSADHSPVAAEMLRPYLHKYPQP